jgi:transposase
VEDRGEVCLEEEVARLYEAGMEADEIASRMGVDVAWVETLVSMWEPEDG